MIECMIFCRAEAVIRREREYRDLVEQAFEHLILV